ncbi:MAG: amidohydrolase family protein [Planctomycetes bacterium]|nr:amidohydrolase family protein [Planctomycetota bacterium]
MLNRRELLKTGAAGMAAALGLGAFTASSAAPSPQSQPNRPPEKLKIIDIHNHPYWLGHDPRKMIENMDALGIDQSCLLSWEVPRHEMDPAYFNTLNPTGLGIPFADVARACELYPDRFICGYAPDPRRPEAQAQLKSAVSLYKVRIFGEFKIRILYDDPDALAMFWLCGELGLPVLFHLDVVLPRAQVQKNRQYWYGGHIDNVERALKQCPHTRFLGHAPGFWREISGDAESEPQAYPNGKPVAPGGKLLQLLDRYPNLHCDLSAGSGHTALTRDPEFSRKFLIDYQDRVLYGRDQFDNIHQEFLRSINLPREVLAKIYAGNAIKLLKN